MEKFLYYLVGVLTGLAASIVAYLAVLTYMIGGVPK